MVLCGDGIISMMMSVFTGVSERRKIHCNM